MEQWANLMAETNSYNAEYTPPCPRLDFYTKQHDVVYHFYFGDQRCLNVHH